MANASKSPLEPSSYITAEQGRMYDAQARRSKREARELANLAPQARAIWTEGLDRQPGIFNSYLSWPVEQSFDEIEQLLEENVRQQIAALRRHW